MSFFHRFIIFTNKIKFYIIYIGVASPLAARAEDIPNPLRAGSFACLIEDITGIILAIGLPLAAVMIIYSGFLFATSRGNEKKLEDAKKSFYWAIIGAAVIIGARVIAAAVVNFAAGIDGSSIAAPKCN